LRNSALVFALLALACRREPERRDRTEPWAAPGVTASASSPVTKTAARVRYVLEQGKVEFELPARQGKPRGTVSKVRAELDLDPAALEKTTGTVELDLGSLALFGDGGDEADPERTKRGLEWLGLGASVATEARETARTAVFRVRSLEARPTGTWLVRGELALAGVRAPETVEIGVSPALDGVSGTPERLLIRSIAPLVVSLSTHDIRPRDHRGAAISSDLELLGQRVGRDARVSFTLTLRKQP
jgi:polyisoprenoid-binding protein YceI